jgi:uncharacterized protein
MTLNNIFQFLVPKDKQFFPLFKQSTTNLIEISNTLKQLTSSESNQRSIFFEKIATLKEKNEKISHEINLELSKSFLTPFDREDIHALVTGLDSVVKSLAGASCRIKLYNLTKVSNSIKELAEINYQACVILDKAVSELENKKIVVEIIKQTNKLEDQADLIYDKAVENLFKDENDFKTLIMNKEVLQSLEKASDRCKNVAKIIEMILVKHA